MNTQFRLAVLAASALALSVGHAQGTGAALGRKQAARRNPQPQSEVVVLGIDHVYYGEGYRAAHLRAFLAAVKPTAIGIENPASFQARGELRASLFEEKEALAYAKANGLPVYGVDWEPPDVPQTPTREAWQKAALGWLAQAAARESRPPAVPRAAGLSELDARRLRLRRGFEASVQNRRLFGGASRSMEFMNSDAAVRFTGDANRTDADPWPDWKGFNAVIVENIRAAARKNPGGRLLVVFGGAHKPLLDAGLSQAPEVRLRQPTEWFPLDEKTVARFDTPDDLKTFFLFTTEDVAILSNPDAIHRRWIRTQVGPLQKLAITDLEARYYLARWFTIDGQREKAAELLRQVADEAKDQRLEQDPVIAQTMSFWPPELGLRRRALFGLALVHDLAGRRDSATAIYDGLRLELEEDLAAEGKTPKATAPPSGASSAASPASRFARWVNLFLAEPYIDHPDQYLKGLVF
jgi:hypothetical protein